MSRGGNGAPGPSGDFGQAVELAVRQVAAGSPPERLADRLAGAAAELLGMDAGTVCVLFAPQMSVPVGASDPAAERAEQLQFTTGEGPCWVAYATGVGMLVDDLDDLDDLGGDDDSDGDRSRAGGGAAVAARQWPAYSAAMRGTPFRGVASVPLHLALGVPTVLNLYSRAPLPGPARDGDALGAVARSVTASLDAGGREWLESTSTRRRAQVWVAEWLLVQHAPHLDAQTALAGLRTYCAVEGGTVDEVSDALVRGELSPQRVLGSG